MFEEDRFQNLVQAAEAYHRRVVGNRPDSELHDTRSAAVLAAAPEDLRDWLEGILVGAKEYRLAERIEALVSRHAWIAADLIKNRNVHRWAGRVAMARNFRAHHDPGAPHFGTDVDDLVGLTQRLTVLIEACLLDEAGFSSDQIQEMVPRASQAYSLLRLNPGL
jgi:hypothetical protein